MVQNAAMTQPGVLTSVLLIGIGNPLRGDDGAGWVLARRLAEQVQARAQPVSLLRTAVHLRLVQQLTPELAAELAELAPALVIFADAAAPTAAPAAADAVAATIADPAGSAAAALTMLRRESGAQGLAWGGSHALGPAQLLEISRLLYNFDCEAWLLTVIGAAFGHGEGLSATAAAGVEEALRLALAALGL